MDNTHAATVAQPLPHAAIERLTEAFRHGLAAKHRAKVAENRASLKSVRAARSSVTPLLPLLPATSAKSTYGRAFNESLSSARAELAERDYDAGPRDLFEAHADTLRTLEASSRWHEQRARGQIRRFSLVRSCCQRVMIVHCAIGNHDGKPTPEHCGNARVCSKCSVRSAIRKRARFGRGRARTVVLDAHRFGPRLKTRTGSPYSEKMLTLTVPHFESANVTPDSLVASHANGCTVQARVHAVFRAWTLFTRRMRSYWKARHEHETVKAHRSFEWTPGSDEKGHPHFHVWMWCPYVPVLFIKTLWAESLLKVGVPVEKRPWSPKELKRHHLTDAQKKEGTWNVSVDLGNFESWDANAMAELLKGGKRDALKLSRGPANWRGAARSLPTNAVEYAEGWSLANLGDDVSTETKAALYMALEGKRLTQGSAGFFVDDPPCQCQQCPEILRAFRHVLVRFEAPKTLPPKPPGEPP